MPGPRDAAIVGVYTTKQTRGEGRSGFSHAMEALRGALDDAGLTIQDVEGLFVQLDAWPQNPAAPVYGMKANWSYLLGIPLRWQTGAVNAADSGAPAIVDAAAAIKTGNVDTVAIILGRGMTQPPDGRTAPWTRHVQEFTGWTGSYTAVQFALVASRHMAMYGTTPEQLAAASATVRNYGHVNPQALMYGRGPYDVERVVNARMIASPLTVLMCAQVNDGGGAMIITTAERARDLKKPPVHILGGGDQLSYPAYAEAPLLEHHLGGPFATDWVDNGFARAGVTRDDVDFVELYDGFAIWMLTQWEMLGFCKPGEGGPFVESGVMELDGRYPTCTDGGCMAFSHNGTPSLFRPIEAARQLRGEVMDDCPGSGQIEHTHVKGVCRAVRDPKVGMAVTMGPPTGGGNFVLLAKD